MGVALPFMMFWWAYEYIFQDRRGPFGIGGALGGFITVLGGSFWLYLAAKRFRDVRRAKLEGRDPAIMR